MRLELPGDYADLDAAHSIISLVLYINAVWRFSPEHIPFASLP